MSKLDELLDEVVNTAVRQIHVDSGVSAKAELATLRAALSASQAREAALRDAIHLAYLTNSPTSYDTSQCDEILASALGHKIGCWAIGAIPDKQCDCGGVANAPRP